MAKSRDWNALTDTYRSRLSRAGITKDAYEGGAKLGAARGHAKTPEHPREAAKRPEKFPEYVAKKSKAYTPRPPITGGSGKPKGPPRGLQNKVIAYKDQLFGDRFRYDVENSIEFVRYGRASDGIPKPTPEQLEAALRLSEEQAERYASLANGDDSQYKEWRFMWYH